MLRQYTKKIFNSYIHNTWTHGYMDTHVLMYFSPLDKYNKINP